LLLHRSTAAPPSPVTLNFGIEIVSSSEAHGSHNLSGLSATPFVPVDRKERWATACYDVPRTPEMAVDRAPPAPTEKFLPQAWLHRADEPKRRGYLSGAKLAEAEARSRANDLHMDLARYMLED